MRFIHMSEEEKLEHLNSKLDDLLDFLNQVKPWSSYDSSVNLSKDEFKWTMGKLNNDKN